MPERWALVDARRVLYSVYVIVLLALAVSGPVAMIRFNQATASPSPEPGAVAAPAGGAAAAPRVGMAGLAFAPATLTVAKGTTVRFDNDDVAPHTVTGGSVDSGTIAPGGTFSLQVNEPLDYHCEIHPSMTAKILLAG
jgi:plastocyanin